MPSRLTFGVEFEFAFALLEGGQPDPEPELLQPVTFLPTVDSKRSCTIHSNRVKNKVFDLIANKMIAAGLPARNVTAGVSPDNSHRDSSDGSGDVQDDGVGWIPSRGRQYGRNSRIQGFEKSVEDKTENEDQVDPNNKPLATPVDEFGSQWVVTEDWSIGHMASLTYVWHPIEVQSPPYIFCEDSLEAVRLACRVITSEFRVETNATTGLHVHVGEGADGYTLQSIKKLMAFLWTFEPQIDQLHPRRRARLSDNEMATWYESLRRGSVLCARVSLDGTYPIKVLDGLKIIFEAGDIDVLNGLVESDYMKPAYKIEHLTIENTIKKTVEFRQHEGTMDGTRVVEWIKTVVALVEWIIDVDSTVLLDFLEEAASFEDACWPEEEQPPYDIIDLFNDMGLVEQATYWDQAIPKSVRIKPTEYYKHLRESPKQPSAPHIKTPTPNETINDSDQRDLDQGMLRAGEPTTPPRQTSQRTSAYWSRIFRG
jgi:hypothetical protein